MGQSRPGLLQGLAVGGVGHVEEALQRGDLQGEHLARMQAARVAALDDGRRAAVAGELGQGLGQRVGQGVSKGLRGQGGEVAESEGSSERMSGCMFVFPIGVAPAYGSRNRHCPDKGCSPLWRQDTKKPRG